MDEPNGTDSLLVTTSSVAEAYGVTEAGIADAYTEILAGPALQTYPSLQHVAILNIALAHEGCAGCPTCDQVRIGLENAMAVLRIDMETELQQVTDGSEPER